MHQSFGHRFDRVAVTAARGLRGASEPLPHLERIQAAFGRHDVSGVRAHRGYNAGAAARSLGAAAYTKGGEVAFGDDAPSLHTAAHEAAHALFARDRGRAPRKQAVSDGADAHERHADHVADLVASGRSAERELDRDVSGAPPEVQRKIIKTASPFGAEAKEEDPVLYESAEAVIQDLVAASTLLTAMRPVFEESLAAQLEELLADDEFHTLKEIATGLVPTVLIGEEHTEAEARQFLLDNLDFLKAVGVEDVVIEYDGSVALGAFVRDYASKPSDVPETVTAKTTLQEILDLARANQAVREAVPVLLASKHVCDPTLGGVAVRALEKGMSIVCGDYTPPFESTVSPEAMDARNASFAKTLCGLAANGRRAVLLVGHLHVQGIQKKLNEADPSVPHWSKKFEKNVKASKWKPPVIKYAKAPPGPSHDKVEEPPPT